MKLAALLDEVTKAVESSDSTANSHVTLAQQISDLADMVGWAAGPIDPEQRLSGRFQLLMEALRVRYQRTNEVSIAALHDALGDFYSAMSRHDRDFNATETDDDSVDF